MVGVLGILSVLAAGFVTLAGMERKASRQRLHTAKAAFLARSGLEDALARMAAGQDPSRPSTAFAGEDFDGNGLLTSGLETSEQRFRPTTLDVETCPLPYALRPSFFVDDRTGPGASPALLSISGESRGYSGRLRGDHTPLGNAYALKMEDESAKLNVNGGLLDHKDRDADGVPDHRDADLTQGWNTTLARLLDRLGTPLGIGSFGTRAVGTRPAGGYASIQALQDALGISMDLSPYLTVSSGIDRSVVRPNARENEPTWGALSDLKKERGPLRLEEGGRPPVNLNAASLPVLEALLDGLRGRTCQDMSFDLLPPDDPGAQIPLTTPYEIDEAMTGDIARAIVDYREGRDPLGCFAEAGLHPGPFRDWSAFHAFCDALADSVITGMEGLAMTGGGNLCGADLLKANFNPNTGLNKQLPDQLAWKWLDKSDLLAGSTEGSLGPTGIFRITATGTLRDARGTLLARATVGATVEVFRWMRQTSQKDFLGGRPPEKAFSPGTDPRHRASGGLTLLSHPCPPPALPREAADFDGWLSLSTVDMEPAVPEGTLYFLHHFDDGFEADAGGAPGLLSPGPGTPASDALLQVDPSLGVWPSDGAEPNTLLPDGLHSQKRRCPTYAAALNLPPPTLVSGEAPSNRAVFGYWFKPMAEIGNDIHLSCVGRTGDATQVLALGQSNVVEIGILFENSRAVWDDDTGREREYGTFSTGGRIPGGRWRLVVAGFDTRERLPQDGFISVRGVGETWIPEGRYPDADPGLRQDLMEDATHLVVGGQVLGLFADIPHSNQVIDELAVADFGPLGGVGRERAEAWSLLRYQAGRYYKRNDGIYRSPSLDLDGAAFHVLWASWTAYLPRESRRERVLGGTIGRGHPRVLDATLEGSDLLLELLDEAGDPLTILVGGLPVGRSLKHLRYQVTFRPTPGWTETDHLNQPVLETPILDDVGFACQPLEGPRVLAWGP